MNKKELLDHLKNHLYCRIGASKVVNVGVIAIRDIPEGIDPFFGIPDHDDIEFDMKELEDLDPAVKRMIDDFCVEEDGKVFLPTTGLYGLNISYFLNHSDNPNVALVDIENGIFKTLREIKKGEELFFDYAKAFGHKEKQKTLTLGAL